jgi:nitronate monooxygenase
MRNLALPAQKAGRADLLALWAGQSANLAQYPGILQLLQSLVEDTAKRLGRDE